MKFICSVCGREIKGAPTLALKPCEGECFGVMLPIADTEPEPDIPEGKSIPVHLEE